MDIKEEIIKLNFLVASEGKVLISKSKDEEGRPVVIAKRIRLAVGDIKDNYEEVDEGSVISDDNNT